AQLPPPQPASPAPPKPRPAPAQPAPAPLAPAPVTPAQSGGSVYYKNCAAARAAGAAPIYAVQPGYRPGLDGDKDGVACEYALPCRLPSDRSGRGPRAAARHQRPRPAVRAQAAGLSGQ